MQRGKSIYLAVTAIIFIIITSAAKPETTNIKYRKLYLYALNDSIHKDSLSQDSIQKDSTKKEAVFTDKITYSFSDSSTMEFKGSQKVFLYGDAEVNYLSIKLKADIIDFDMSNNTVFAKGRLDSTGHRTGRPVFTDEGETFEADSLTYNFKTKKGLTYGVATKQSEGYLHGAVMKKHESGEIHFAGGKFTTCEYANPDYYIALSKAKVIPGDKIISGPLHFVIADIPIPVFLPFGYFPQHNTYTSGILIPSYGEERARGFYLREGGYYWHINEYVNLAVVGDIYSEGGWGMQAKSSYRKKYKYSGNINLRYNRNIVGEEGSPDFSKSNSYQILWSHNQDPKARPNSNFSANVNFKSSNYKKFNASTNNEYLSNTFGSSVSFRKTWANSPFNLSANLRHSQNTSTKMVSLDLPTISFNMTRQFPTQTIRKILDMDEPLKPKWYDQISIGYSANFKRYINAADSIVFTSAARYTSGFMHDIPISVPLRIKKLKNVSANLSLQYHGRLYFDEVYKHYEDEWINGKDTIRNKVIDDISDSWHYAHMINPNASISYSPKIFGIFRFKNEKKHKVKAVRHAMMPSVSLSMKPDVRDIIDDEKYYSYYYEKEKEYRYFIFENGAYNLPTAGRKSGSVNFSLNNTLEMKIKDRKDTAQELKKVKIIDRFNMGTSYNIFKDSLKWSGIRMGASTKLFNKLLNINVSANFDMYGFDKNGRKINVFYIEQKKKLLQLKSINLTSSMSFNANSFKKGEPIKPDLFDPLYYNPYFGSLGLKYVDYKIPWNISFSYSFRYGTSGFDKDKQEYKYKPNQSMRFNGNLSLSAKWKAGISSGYSFEEKSFTHTSANLYRDLHCWEMQISWVPFGKMKSYNFRINIKSSMFKDLKYKKQKTHIDNANNW